MRLCLSVGSRSRFAAIGFAAATTLMLPPARAAEAPPEPATPAPAVADPAVPSVVGDEVFVDEDGLRYRIGVIPRVEGTYRLIDEHTVRFRGGVILPVVSYDDQNIRIKVFEEVAPAPPPATPQPEPPEGPPPPLPEVDRIVLRPFDEGLPRRGQWRNGFELVDMDADGDRDIVFGAARRQPGRPNVFLSSGDGGWLPADWQYPPLAYDYGDAGVGDFDADGHRDLAFAVHLSGVLVLLGDGKGAFRPWSEGIEFQANTEPGQRGAFSSRALELADWNGDGRLDVLVLGEGPKMPSPGKLPDNGSRGVRVYVNPAADPTGAWQSVTLPLDGAFGEDLAVGDVDRDGRPDLVIASGRLGRRDLLALQRSDGSVEVRELPLPSRILVRAVELADLDADGWLDLAATVLRHEEQWTVELEVLWGGKEGWIRQRLLAQPTNEGFRALAVGDVDGDGHLDVATVDAEGRPILVLGDGRRGFAREQMAADEVTPGWEGCAGYSLRLADLNEDRKAEVVLALAGEPSAFAQWLGTTSAGSPSRPSCREGGAIRVWSPRPGVDPADMPPPMGD